MPYNIWCDGCNKHIAMGVRYNAEKSKIGMYYTTPIYKFRMKCHLCDNHFEIKTDPAVRVIDCLQYVNSYAILADPLLHLYHVLQLPLCTSCKSHLDSRRSIDFFLFF
jgi:Saf4/Yju2 protein